MTGKSDRKTVSHENETPLVERCVIKVADEDVHSLLDDSAVQILCNDYNCVINVLPETEVCVEDGKVMRLVEISGKRLIDLQKECDNIFATNGTDDTQVGIDISLESQSSSLSILPSEENSFQSECNNSGSGDDVSFELPYASWNSSNVPKTPSPVGTDIKTMLEKPIVSTIATQYSVLVAQKSLRDVGNDPITDCTPVAVNTKPPMVDSSFQVVENTDEEKVEAQKLVEKLGFVLNRYLDSKNKLKEKKKSVFLPKEKRPFLTEKFSNKFTKAYWKEGDIVKAVVVCCKTCCSNVNLDDSSFHECGKCSGDKNLNEENDISEKSIATYYPMLNPVVPPRNRRLSKTSITSKNSVSKTFQDSGYLFSDSVMGIKFVINRRKAIIDATKQIKSRLHKNLKELNGTSLCNSDSLENMELEVGKALSKDS